MELIRAANPEAPPPPFLAAPPDTTLHGWLPPAAAAEAAALLVDEYWNTGAFTAEQLARAHHGSPAWVGARDRDGRLIASARALADGGKLAWIYDVVVAEAWRGLGLGKAVMRLLLDHPQVRGTTRLFLGTRDAQSLYERLGFVDLAAAPPRPFATTTMVLIR
jgi:ribosomal protein S18 acetylase RimI-like enzyme